MSKHTKEINAGGVNGTGKGMVNTNSKDFQGLRAAIREHAKQQTPEERMYYKLIGIKPILPQ